MMCVRGFLVALTAGVLWSTVSHLHAQQLQNSQPSAPEIQELRNIAHTLQAQRRIAPADYQTLKLLQRAYPSEQNIAALLLNANIVREDWAAVIEHFESLPQNVRTHAQTLSLAAAYLKLGNYLSATHVAKPLADESPQARSILAQSYLAMGQQWQVIEILNPHRDALVNQRQLSDLTVLATAYFELSEIDEAKHILLGVQDLQPGHIASAQLLGRIYSLAGNVDEAEAYFSLAEQEYAIITAKEKEGMQLQHYSTALHGALQARDFQRVLKLSAEARTQLSAQHHQILDQYEQRARQGLDTRQESTP